MGYWLMGGEGKRNLKVRLHEGCNRFGRSRSEATHVIAHYTISRLHAEIVVEKDDLVIRDLRSRTGTLVNGQPVASQALHPGDEIALGDVHLTLVEDGTAPKPRFSRDSSLRDLELTWSESSVATKSASPEARFLATLADLGEFLIQDDAPEDACKRCFELVSQHFSFRLACLFVMNEADEPEVRCAYPQDQRTLELQVSRSLVETVVREARSLLVRDAAQDGRLSRSVQVKGIRSALVVPLLRAGRVMGVLYMDQDNPRLAFGERHLWQLEVLANLVAAKLVAAWSLNEMRWAAFIQRNFLCAPQCPEGYELAVRLEPSELVGGDLYETLRLPDGRYLFALGDVSGHGVGAALLMANALGTLRALAPSSGTPLELAERLRALLAARLAPCGFITLFLGFLDPQRHRLDYVNAGHEPPLLLAPEGCVQWLQSTGPPIGMEIGIPLEPAATPIPPGSVCAAWSDGIHGALRPHPRPQQPFSLERVVKCFERHRDASATQIVDVIFREVDAWLGGTQAQDDRTLLVFRNRASSEDSACAAGQARRAAPERGVGSVRATGSS